VLRRDVDGSLCIFTKEHLEGVCVICSGLNPIELLANRKLLNLSNTNVIVGETDKVGFICSG